MANLSGYWFGLMQGLLLLALAPGLLGLLRWAKARAQGRRRGVTTALQPYRDLWRLMGQPPVRARTSSWLFAAVPIVLWACYGTLAFAVPLLVQPALLRIDLVTFMYLLALARFALALGGMDAAAPFGGLGGSRSMFMNLPTEVALVLIGAALSLRWGTLSLLGLVERQWSLGPSYLIEADLLLVAGAFGTAIALEAGRLPVENPESHHALSMSDGAIRLEYAGRDLALLTWAESVKLSVLLALFVSLFGLPLVRGLTQPWLIDPIAILSLGLLSGAFLILAVCSVAWREAMQPKLRLRKAVGLAITSVGLSLSAILYLVVSGAGGQP